VVIWTDAKVEGIVVERERERGELCVRVMIVSSLRKMFHKVEHDYNKEEGRTVQSVGVLKFRPFFPFGMEESKWSFMDREREI
jgi:KaiC/GvpD/RAD55 family RecA-like ATPase